MALVVCEHSQKRSNGATNIELVMVSGTMIRELSKSSDRWIRFIGLRRDFVLNIVTTIDKFINKDTGATSSNLIDKIVAVAIFQCGNSPRLSSLELFITHLVKIIILLLYNTLQISHQLLHFFFRICLSQ